MPQFKSMRMSFKSYQGFFFLFIWKCLCVPYRTSLLLWMCQRKKTLRLKDPVLPTRTVSESACRTCRKPKLCMRWAAQHYLTASLHTVCCFPPDTNPHFLPLSHRSSTSLWWAWSFTPGPAVTWSQTLSLTPYVPYSTASAQTLRCQTRTAPSWQAPSWWTRTIRQVTKVNSLCFLMFCWLWV